MGLRQERWTRLDVEVALEAPRHTHRINSVSRSHCDGYNCPDDDPSLFYLGRRGGRIELRSSGGYS